MEKQSSSEHEEVKLEPDEENSSPSKFQVNMGLIQSASLGEEEDDLKSLNIGVFNQEDLEQGKKSFKVVFYVLFIYCVTTKTSSSSK